MKKYQSKFSTILEFSILKGENLRLEQFPKDYFGRIFMLLLLILCGLRHLFFFRSVFDSVKLMLISFSLYCQLAQQTFREALGDGIWLAFIDGKENSPPVDASASVLRYKDMHLFQHLEKEGRVVDLPWSKVTALFNMARLLEQLHNTETASTLYCLILFKVRCICVFVCMTRVCFIQYVNNI